MGNCTFHRTCPCYQPFYLHHQGNHGKLELSFRALTLPAGRIWRNYFANGGDLKILVPEERSEWMLYVAFIWERVKGLLRRGERRILHLTSKPICATEYLDHETHIGKKDYEQ